MDENTVIFVLGCQGDVAVHRIFPALFRLFNSHTLTPGTHIIGFTRTIAGETAEEKNETMREAIEKYLGAGDSKTFFELCHFMDGEATSPKTMEMLEDLGKKVTGVDGYKRIYYFAIHSQYFLKTIEAIPMGSAGDTRVVLEKPLGKDLNSSNILSKALSDKFGEANVYRLDHFLGRKMAANIHVLRFMNKMTEPVWSREHVAAIVIACRESQLPKKGTAMFSYFEKHGIIRDIIVDHLLNLVALVCMEPPVTLSDKALQDEKLKLLKKIKVVNRKDSRLVLGKCNAYAGKQPTFATMVLTIDTDRWRGVPIILKAGKGINEKRTDIRIQLKNPLFGTYDTTRPMDVDDVLPSTHSLRKVAPRNEIVIRVQPNEDMYVKVVTGASGSMVMETKLDFLASDPTEKKHTFTRSPYERLLADVVRGNREAFIDAEVLEQRWKLFSDLVTEIDTATDFIPYELGSRGPEESDVVMKEVGFVKQVKIGTELIGVKETSTLSVLQSKFDISNDTMQGIIADFFQEIRDGLACKPSSLKMLPSYVTKLPDGTEEGVYYALDIGGTNFRVTRFELDGHGKAELTDERKFTIPDQVMVASEPDALYEFLAECITTVKGEQNDIRKYGYTFSFPCKQLAIDKGVLINWTKGFKTKGVEGQEVVAPLQAALKKLGFEGKIVALVNDTVGTLASGAYHDPSCCIGIILGTGTNAAYREDARNIMALPEDMRKGEMVINMEWGAFGDRRKMLPVTEVNEMLDEQSRNPKQQSFEKMISGFYLGEIARLAMVKLIKAKELFALPGTNVTKEIYEPYSFKSWYLSDIEYDLSHGYKVIEKVLNQYGITGVSDDDKIIMKEISGMIIDRAAKLTACAIVATLKHLKKPAAECSVGIDGSVFEHHPSFRQRLDQALTELGYECRVFLSKDGSGKGAALIASGL